MHPGQNSHLRSGRAAVPAGLHSDMRVSPFLCVRVRVTSSRPREAPVTALRRAARQLELHSAAFAFAACGLRSVAGVCVRLTGRARAALDDCGVGGVGPEPGAQCSAGMSLWDVSRVEARRTGLADGGFGSAGIRAAGAAGVEMEGCRLERLFVAAALHNASRARLARCAVANTSRGAFFCDPEVGGGMGVRITEPALL